MDRTIHFGDDEADARYRIQDTSSTGGDLVLAEDLDGGTVLLEYDYSASEWVSRGPVNLSGNDITNAGSISADTLEAGSLGHAIEDLTSVSKTNGTVYQNTSNYNLFVRIQVENDTGTENLLNPLLIVENSTSPSETVDGFAEDVGNTNWRTLKAVVPPGEYYKLSLFAQGSVRDWREGVYK
jgi:hypothetical protein